MSTLVTLGACVLLGAILIGVWRWLAAPRQQAALASWHGAKIALAWLGALLYLPIALWLLAVGAFGQQHVAAVVGGVLYACTLVVWGGVIVLTWQWAAARARQRASH